MFMVGGLLGDTAEGLCGTGKGGHQEEAVFAQPLTQRGGSSQTYRWPPVSQMISSVLLWAL